jgi:hypothetical protein
LEEILPGLEISFCVGADCGELGLRKRLRRLIRMCLGMIKEG